jgi:hypothetical protein
MTTLPQRYVLLYSDADIPAAHLTTIQAIPGLVVATQTVSMLVVEAPMTLRSLKAAMKGLKGWTIGKETADTVPLAP